MSLFGQSLIVIAAAMTLLWLVSLLRRDASIVDAFWGTGFILVIGYAFAVTPPAQVQLRCWLLVGLVLIWGLRLSIHLLLRNLRHGLEDYRYRAMREHWGPRAHANLFWFYLVQAAAAWLFALPFWFLAGSPAATLEPLQWAGLGLLLVAQFAEGLADRQLEQHRRDPGQKGRACRRGLWRYSRHPNYFCEWLSWCGIAAIAAPTAGWLALLQPILMFVLVRFVSGVPFAELQSIKSRGDDYRRYQQETNAFVPWFPRRSDGGAR